jgi:ribosomal protein S18 acetylase RimI-like enzyme
MNQSPDVVRAFSPEADFPRLLRLLGEVEAFDHDGEDTSEETQRTYMTLPHHDPAQDRWVIEAPEEPDRLIGFASTWARTVWSEDFERAESYIAVHPHWRRSGLGCALLERITQRARELGANHLVLHVNERNRDSNRFLQQQGFEIAGDYWLLRIRLNTPLEEPVWPAGYTVRNYAAVQDLSALVTVSLESYRDRWGHYGPKPGEPPMPWLSRLDHEGILLVFAPPGDVAGFCIAEQRAQSGIQAAAEGHINGPGVLPIHRERGLHRPLILTALQWQQARGCQTITLDAWGDDDQTIALYRELGFEPVHHLISYRQRLI